MSFARKRKPYAGYRFVCIRSGWQLVPSKAPPFAIRLSGRTDYPCCACKPERQTHLER